MDVHCSTCDEPWDTYHLQWEAIYDTGLPLDEAEAWRKLPPAEKLTKRLRDEFAAAGWEFGSSVLNVRHCPACPTEAQINAEKDEIKTVLEELLGDDHDGLAVTFEDYGL